MKEKMKSKTEIKKRIENKTNPELVETIRFANKNNSWRKVVQKISESRRKARGINLEEINKNSKEGDTIVVCSKILGVGNLEKRIKICALHFSENARKKIKENKSEAVILIDEMKKNPKAEGVKILG